MEKKRYAQVGIGGRAIMYYRVISGDFKEYADLVGFCDINRSRMEYANRKLVNELGYHEIPMYGADEFEKMIEETKPDVVIVTSMDRTHHRYIIKAMECGCDVITEKPMTMDAKKCQEIVDCIERTGKDLRVTFNYRYAPDKTKVRELIMNGTIGDVKQVHFEWLLNTSHGADYFRRWHRNKPNSGGLLVHKATHHFDLVNFWINSYPTKVFALGDLKFYGRENAEERGVTKFYYRSYGSENAKGDPFAMNIAVGGNKDLYFDCEKDDGYLRDQSVFGDGISIEDTMNLVVQYASGCQMSYSLNAYSPWEGFRVMFTGTKGRIELEVVEAVNRDLGIEHGKNSAIKDKKLTVYPMFKPYYEVEIEEGTGGHGGGDPVMLNDIFNPNPPVDPYKRAAGYIDGCMSILTGIAGNKSIATGMPVEVKDLVDIPDFKKKWVER